PGGVQPVSARSDDRRGHGVNADGLHHLLHEPRDHREVRHLEPGADYAVPHLRHLPLSVPRSPEGCRQSVGGAVDGSTPRRVHPSLGPGGDRHHLAADGVVDDGMNQSTVAVLQTRPATVIRDYHELMNLARYQDVLAKDVDTALKVNISWHFFFPG